MGGRAAEETVFDDITTGAHGDIRHATQIARNMVCVWGMSETLGPQSYSENQELMFLGREVARTQNISEDTACKIDAEISRLLSEAHEKALRVVTEHRDKLAMIAERLLERETIDGRDVEEIVAHGRVLTEDERDAVDLAVGADEGAGDPKEATATEARSLGS
jgi:cell division protease FtsH